MVVAFLEKKGKGPCFDVRSPLEYNQGHIPGAINLPLFTDEERAQVGTLYKKKGEIEAIELGVALVGPKLPDLLELVKMHSSRAELLRIYCFRGGMRSSFVSWFLNFVGFQTETLKGGYKAFRRFVLAKFNEAFPLIVLGGFTGSGKTKILDTLKSLGEQVIDLEKLAFHRGSSFGLAPGGIQPSVEQFENEIACTIAHLKLEKPIWVEDESRQIGACTIPNAFFKAMKRAPLLIVECSIEERLQHILELYGGYPKEYLLACVERIAKRLGGEKVKVISTHIKNNELAKAVRLLLQYYDASYAYALEKHIGTKKFISKELFYDAISSSRLDSIFENSADCL